MSPPPTLSSRFSLIAPAVSINLQSGTKEKASLDQYQWSENVHTILLRLLLSVCSDRGSTCTVRHAWTTTAVIFHFGLEHTHHSSQKSTVASEYVWKAWYKLRWTDCHPFVNLRYCHHTHSLWLRLSGRVVFWNCDSSVSEEFPVWGAAKMEVLLRNLNDVSQIHDTGTLSGLFSQDSCFKWDRRLHAKQKKQYESEIDTLSHGN